MAKKTKKPIKRLRTGAFSRTVSIARLSLGAGASAAGHALGGLFRGEEAKGESQRLHWLAQAGRLVGGLGELKGSLMKAGQMLSVYGEHFLPPEVNQILRTLQSDSLPVEWESVRKVLVRQLGESALEKLEIDQEPAGAASLGQVHRAVVRKTGEEIALKVQYPGVDRAIDGDLRALRRLLSLTEWLPKLPATDNLFEEVRQMLRREVNYELESEMLEFFARELKADPRYIVPKVYGDFSRKRVLAMSFERGVGIDGPEVAALSQTKRNELALAALELFFRELFEWRRVQTDPHFGNFKVRLGEGGEPARLVLLDFGAVRDLPEKFVRNYARMLRGVLAGDRPAFEKAADHLEVLKASDSAELKEMFYELCRMITEPFQEKQPFDWRENRLPQRVSQAGWEMVKRFPLRAPPRELVFLDRKLAGIFTLLAKLGARIDARAALLPYLEELS